MTTSRTTWLISLSLALPLSATPLITAGQSAPAAGNSPPTASPVPLYQPPLRGAPATRVGGASRGAEDQLILNVLAPESTGLTSRAQPTLYWYCSKALPTPLEFTLNDAQAIKPLVEQKVPVAQPGIHALKLNYALKPDVEYQWNVATGPRAGDTLAGGTIKYLPLSAALAAPLKAASPQQHPFLYAREGYWYDAIATLSEQIKAQPANRNLREQRAALLEQVGLNTAAAYDRETAK